MGLLIRYGSRDTAPEFMFNHCGVQAWCGKRVVELDEMLAHDMRVFVEREAFVQGRQCGATKDMPSWNPFDRHFLFGEPARIWGERFDAGRRRAASGHEPAAEGPAPRDLVGGHNVVRSLIAMCDELAAGFENSYLDLGVSRKSAFRSQGRALRGWTVPDVLSMCGDPEYTYYMPLDVGLKVQAIPKGACVHHNASPALVALLFALTGAPAPMCAVRLCDERFVLPVGRAAAQRLLETMLLWRTRPRLQRDLAQRSCTPEDFGQLEQQLRLFLYSHALQVSQVNHISWRIADAGGTPQRSRSARQCWLNAP